MRHVGQENGFGFVGALSGRTRFFGFNGGLEQLGVGLGQVRRAGGHALFQFVVRLLQILFRALQGKILARHHHDPCPRKHQPSKESQNNPDDVLGLPPRRQRNNGDIAWRIDQQLETGGAPALAGG